MDNAGNAKTNFPQTPEPDMLAAETSNMLGGAKVLEISFVPSGSQAMSMQPSWVVSQPDGKMTRPDRQIVSNSNNLDQLFINKPQSVGFGRTDTTGNIGNAADLSSNLQNSMSEMMSPMSSANRGTAAQDFPQEGQNMIGMMDATGSSMNGGRGQMRNNIDGFVTSVNNINGPLTGNIGGSTAQDFQQQGRDWTGMMDSTGSTNTGGRGQILNNLDGFSNSFTAVDGSMIGNMGGSTAQDFQQQGRDLVGMMDAAGSSMTGSRGQMRNNINGFASSMNTIDGALTGNMGGSAAQDFQQMGQNMMGVMDADRRQMRNNIDGFGTSINTLDGSMTGNMGGSTAQDFQQLGQNMIGMMDASGSFMTEGQGQRMNNVDGFSNSLNNVDVSLSRSRDFMRSSQDMLGMLDPSGSSNAGGQGATNFDTLNGRMDVRRSHINDFQQADQNMMGLTVEQVPLANGPIEMGTSSGESRHVGSGSNNDMSNAMFDGNSQILSSMDIHGLTSRNGQGLSSTNSNIFSPSGSPVMDMNRQAFMDTRGFTDQNGSPMMDGGYRGAQDSTGLSGPNSNLMDFNRDSTSHIPMARWADSPSGISRNTNNVGNSPSQVDVNQPGSPVTAVESFMNARGYSDVTGPVMMDGGILDAGTMARLNSQNGNVHSNSEYLSRPLESNANTNGNSARDRSDFLTIDMAGSLPSQMDSTQYGSSVMNGLSFSNSRRFTNTDAAGSFMAEGGNRGAPAFPEASG
ncbi:uncharacterized protein [Haliotis cracherodii]|uniref:uncharacterized protein n=1 Tax=Haliotis cracherodii TaxID=6455 RepID=UPI0039E9CD78